MISNFFDKKLLLKEYNYLLKKYEDQKELTKHYRDELQSWQDNLDEKMKEHIDSHKRAAQRWQDDFYRLSGEFAAYREAIQTENKNRKELVESIFANVARLVSGKAGV